MGVIDLHSRVVVVPTACKRVAEPILPAAGPRLRHRVGERNISLSSRSIHKRTVVPWYVEHRGMLSGVDLGSS